MENSKPSVVQVIDRLQVGGAERVLVTVSNILHRHGHKVKVITTVTAGPLVKQLDEGIIHVNLGRQWKWNILMMRKLIMEVRDYDVIHVHSAHNLRYLFLAAKLFRLRKPIFFHEHYGDIHIDERVHWDQRLIYPNTVFIGVSQKHTQWALRELKMPKSKVFLLPNTVEKMDTANAPKKTSDTKQLLLVSNFRPSKNIRFAIEVFKFLRDAHLYPYHFTIIGQVADPTYYKSIRAYIRAQSLEEDITIETGITDIQPVLHRFDFALHTAVSESGPMVLVEYMAQGLPFITYNTGEVVEEIKSKIPLAVMNSFDVYEWSSRVETILGRPLEDLTHKFANVYDHYFSTTAYYQKLMEIYKSGINGNV